MNNISVLHVTYNDVLGGAARYVMRLHNSLIKNGIDSKILVMSKESDNKNVIHVNGNKIYKKLSSGIDKLPLIFYKNQNGKFSTTLFNDFVSRQINNINPDIVHLHWINDGFMSISAIKKIESPIVWSVLDMWPFTGGCHYDNHCGGYINKCGNCPVLNSKYEFDLSRYILKLKQKIFNNVDFTLIAISEWIKECIISSNVMKNKDVSVIHPSLDLSVFRPINKNYSRELFKLPKNKKLILFGATNSTIDSRKGYKQLIDALKKIDKKNISKKVELVVFGATSGDFSNKIKMKVNFIGRLSSGYGIFDDSSLSALYSLADLTIVPSLQEAFGQVASESLACGVPVVAFNSTGLDDIIDHKKDGYLAINNNVTDLYNGIVWGLSNANNKDIFNNSLNKAKSMFDDNKIAKKIIELYKNKIK